jgi:undecaprenyl-diphosphatase
MSILQAIILGIVEGLTEFLPVSSTGHLILASDFLKIPSTEFVKTFEVVIQLGAILAVVALYFRKVLLNWEILKRIVVAFIPTAVIGLALYKVVKQYLLGSATVVVWALLIGGVALILFERWQKDREHAGIDLATMPYRTAALVGLWQALAIIPGVSRAAATIVGGMVLGMERKTIVEFSFLLAIPTMLAASGLDLLKTQLTFSRQEWAALAIGFVTACIVAFFVIKFFIRFIQHNTFTGFGVYRILVALMLLLVL